jgi:hypothetical protein
MTSPATCGLWSLAARERLWTPSGVRRPLRRRSAPASYACYAPTTAAEFTSYCADEGVQRHYSASYSLQQNDVVERRNQMVVRMARALLKQRGMLAFFWREAVVTVVYILNRSPTKALNSRTPYEAWHGHKPMISHLRVFGCLAFDKELGHIDKLDDRSTLGCSSATRRARRSTAFLTQ